MTGSGDIAVHNAGNENVDRSNVTVTPAKQSERNNDVSEQIRNFSFAVLVSVFSTPFVLAADENSGVKVPVSSSYRDSRQCNLRPASAVGPVDLSPALLVLGPLQLPFERVFRHVEERGAPATTNRPAMMATFLKKFCIS